MTTSEWILSSTTVAGLLLSAIIFFNNRRKANRRAKIKSYVGYISDIGHGQEPLLIFNISNPGQKDITLDGPHLRLPDKRTMFFPRLQCPFTFPHTLNEGKAIIAWYSYPRIQQDLVGRGYLGKIRVRAAVRDQTDKTFKSKKFVIGLPPPPTTGIRS